VRRESLVQGRVVGSADVRWLREWVKAHSDWSRKRLARELCVAWQWRDGRGRLKDFAARTFLLKLEARGHLQLPPLQEHQRRRPRGAPEWAGWQEPAAWSGPLRALSPVRVEPVIPGTDLARRWAFYLHRYHYLGLRVVGANLGYLARDVQGRELACLLFGAAAWRCAARDRALGWTEVQRCQGLGRVANNTRFLILPWVRVPQLASAVLGVVVRRIRGDWQVKYGHGLDVLESFVERGRFAGTCYRAANWRCVGSTRGRSRQDRDRRQRVPVKDVYLYPWVGGGQ